MVLQAIGPQFPPWGDFFYEGLSRRVCASAEDLQGAALEGLEQATAIDHQNESLHRGDRSHKLFTATVLRRRGGGDVLRSTFHFLDAAGIPRPAATTAGASKPFGGKSAAERRRDMLAKKEAKKEDPTTKAIVRVVDSLADRLAHVPYRDAKLSRLLKGVLGGCGPGAWRGLLVGCVSGAAGSYVETEAMLQFLQKASIAPGATAAAAAGAAAPFVLNPAVELARRKLRIVALAGELCDTAPEDVDSLRPEDIHCDMESPPELAELRSLLAQRDQLLRDPFQEIRDETAGVGEGAAAGAK